nr:hypothetical protein [Tanacetum cinerariifolium]
MVTEDDEMLKDKEIDKLMDLISLLFKKIYKPTKNNLRTSSNTSRANQDNSLRINRGTGKGMLETETDKGCSLSQRENAIELEAHYMYVAQIQEVSPDTANNSRPIFDAEPLYEDTYLEEQGDTNIIIDSLDMSTNGETVDQYDDDHANEHDLLSSLIEKLKCEIDDKKIVINF